jgi:beta-galactosidase
MKLYHWTILAVIVAIATWSVLKTSDTDPRAEVKIDLNWRFMLGDNEDANKTEFDDADWRIVSLPHDWMIEQAVARENRSGNATGYYPEGIGWYRKHLDISRYKNKKQFYLIFDGVYMNSDVWINGNHLGNHRYGYIGFQYDITPFLRKDTINIIAVRADCSKLPVDRWYSGAGIYRHVRLIASEKLHFPKNNTRISTTEKGNKAFVTAEISVTNFEDKAKRFKIKSDLLGPGGSLIQSVLTTRILEPGESTVITENHTIENPKHWSPDTPHLYELRSFMIYKKKVTDNQLVKFGVRTAAFNPDSGFVLNGEKLWLKGVCLHHDGGELGAAVPDVTWEYRLNQLKLLGVNALRLAHNPHAPEVLDMCDRMGFLVIDEMYDKWEETWNQVNGDFEFQSTWKDDLEFFIKRDINHPSVILWSVGNETAEQLSNPEAGVEWYTRLADLTKELDPGRQVSCALHPGYADRGNEVPSTYIHVSPVVSYNYRTDSFAAWHDRYPEMVWIASETKVYNEERRDNFEEISYMDNSWLDMDTFVAGQFIWTGIDYLGETMGWPDRGFRNGLLHTNGFIKPYAYYTQSIYSEDPMVKMVVVDEEIADSLNNSKNWQTKWFGAPLVNHWTFPLDSDNKHLVVFTNCDQVELQLNSEIVGSLNRSDFEDEVIQTDLAYEPGILVATANSLGKNGKSVTVSDTLRTAGAPTMIMMNADKLILVADGQDVMHIETSVRDSAGTMYPTADHLISYTVDGPGEITAIDNGDPADHDAISYLSKRVNRGRHLVIVRSSLQAGDLTISASAEGLLPASVKVKSLAPEK